MANDQYHYKAFISYAHEDETFAAWMHERLERFVVPKQLRADRGARRLGTLFRDRDELASGGSLSGTILEALQAAEYLIVICSPAAARSQWVNREIEAFVGARSRHNVLLVVADGVPAGDIQFPSALGDDDEMLATDARPFADGPKAALQKLVAGLLQVRFDDLVQRERARRRGRLTVAGSAATLIALAAIGGTYLIQTAAREADERRQQAASFAGLFVDSLEERIIRYEKVGELDADLSKALEFFATLPPDEMDPTTLDHYRTALLGVGTVRIRQGKPEAALEVFHRARALTQSLVERDRDEASRWYDLATHTYYIGEAHWEMQNVPEAAVHIVESVEYAEQAAALAPDEFKYQIEVVFGLNNVGAVNTRLKNYAQATAALERSIGQIEELRKTYSDHETDLLDQEVEAVSWLAEITQKRSQYDEAFAWHDREIKLRKVLIEATDNPSHISRLSDALGYYAESLIAVGETARAAEVLRDKVDASRRVIETDPDNAFFRERLLIGQAMLAGALFEAGDHVGAAAALDDAEQGMVRMIQNDAQANAVRNDLIYVAATRAYLLLRADPARALKLAIDGVGSAVGRIDRTEVNPIVLSYYLRCAAVLSAAERLLGHTPSASIADALVLAEAHGSSESSADLAYRVILLHALGEHTQARVLEEKLQAVGFRPVFYQTMVQILATG